MAKSPKSWRDKFENPPAPEVKPLDKPYAGQPAGARMLIPTPRLIDEYLRQIPSGLSVGVPRMREDLAAQQQADFSCPMTTGIFLRIVSELALEELSQGKAREEVAPFWRVLSPDLPLAKKLSCGPERVTAFRREEGLA